MACILIAGTLRIGVEVERLWFRVRWEDCDGAVGDGGADISPDIHCMIQCAIWRESAEDMIV